MDKIVSVIIIEKPINLLIIPKLLLTISFYVILWDQIRSTIEITVRGEAKSDLSLEK